MPDDLTFKTDLETIWKPDGNKIQTNKPSERFHQAAQNQEGSWHHNQLWQDRTNATAEKINSHTLASLSIRNTTMAKKEKKKGAVYRRCACVLQCRRARVVSFFQFLQVSSEAQQKWLKAGDIIQPVIYSEWAAQVVPILKWQRE